MADTQFVEAQIDSSSTTASRSWLFLVCEFVHRIVEELFIVDSTHSQAVVSNLVLLVGASGVVRVTQLIHGDLVLRAVSIASSTAWWLAVPIVSLVVPVVSVPFVPFMPLPCYVGSMGAAPMSPVTSMPTHNVDTQVESVVRVRIRSRVSVAVVAVTCGYSLNSLVRLLGSLAVVGTVSSLASPTAQPKVVEAVMEATHSSMRGKNVRLAATDL